MIEKFRINFSGTRKSIKVDSYVEMAALYTEMSQLLSFRNIVFIE